MLNNVYNAIFLRVTDFIELGSTISNLFGGSKSTEEGKEEEKPDEVCWHIFYC